MSQSNIQVNSGTGPEVAAFSTTWNSLSSNIQAVAPVDPTSGLAPSVTAAGSVGTNALTVQGIGTSGTIQVSGNVGVSSLPAIPAGTNNIGSVNIANTPTVALSGVPSVSVSNTVAISEDGCTYLNITDNTLHTVSASLLVGFQNLSSSSQSVTVTGYDGNTSATAITAPMQLGAGQIITFPRGGIKSTSGQLSFQCSAAPTTGIQALYHA